MVSHLYIRGITYLYSLVSHIYTPWYHISILLGITYLYSLVSHIYNTPWYHISILIYPISFQTSYNPSVLSLSFHDGALVVNYPWDAHPTLYTGKYAASPDDKLFVHLGSDKILKLLEFYLLLCCNFCLRFNWLLCDTERVQYFLSFSLHMRYF